MTQLGESIKSPEFESTEDHNEKTCPWHCKNDAKAEQMDEPNPETDTATPSMPENNGGKLGRNLEADGKVKPEHKVTLNYAFGEVLKYGPGEKKSVQTYINTKTGTFDLQYAPHHLIPGNESLAESDLGVYLGDDTVITHFNKAGKASRIIDTQSVGYDINAAENGVWLPSPYALSMSNKWTSEDGKTYLLKMKREGDVEIAVSFQQAYVAEAIHISGGRQFHMRHKGYSNEVKDILNCIAAKLEKMENFACPIASDEKKKKDGKIEAPKGLVGRLNILSRQLERLLVGPSWHSPFYADNKLMEEYVKTLKDVKGLKPNITKIL